MVVTHGVRSVSELAYAEQIQRELPEHEFLGDYIRDQLLYYSTVTGEPFRNLGRLTTLIESGKLCVDLGLPPIDPAHDRPMLCGSPGMVKELSRAASRSRRKSARRATT
ncbi:hypothetical protein GCM10025771_28470 [Niveibacterium umoris]|uniref:Ferredoxin-NADP reductase n=1 Tax=Niveibacterium umoris TaxID=1193620 RepID=A0A840BEK1_9RHOO|nr:ferredoxin-NADP reductase [Niveibacterium umoris]